jgi:molybdate transport system permease protein
MNQMLSILKRSKAPAKMQRRRLSEYVATIVVAILVAAALLFVALPILSMFLKISPDTFISELNNKVVTDALKLSFITSISSAIIIVIIGTPIAYVNARYKYPLKELIDTIIDLPVVTPPAVAGIALLLAFGRMGIVGHYLNMVGISVGFTTIAVVMAQTFVASPFYIRQARNSFEDVDVIYEEAARTLGASSVATFFFVTVPIALNGLISGLIMSWARAMGEFGATILFAGSLQGVTQTMPLAIYTEMYSDLNVAIALSIILVIISFIVIAAVKILTRRANINARN